MRFLNKKNKNKKNLKKPVKNLVTIKLFKFILGKNKTKKGFNLFKGLVSGTIGHL